MCLGPSCASDRLLNSTSSAHPVDGRATLTQSTPPVSPHLTMYQSLNFGTPLSVPANHCLGSRETHVLESAFDAKLGLTYLMERDPFYRSFSVYWEDRKTTIFHWRTFCWVGLVFWLRYGWVCGAAALYTCKIEPCCCC